MRLPFRSALLALLAAAALLGVAPGASAQTAAMRDRVYSKLSRAEKAAEAGDFDKAFEELGDVERAKDLTPYERAQLWTTYGFAHYRHDDIARSIESYGRVLEQEELPEALRTSTLYTLAQLTFQQERYGETVAHLQRWMELTPQPGPDPYLLLGQSYTQLQRYDDATAAVRQAISIAERTGRKVEENWFLLLRVLYYERKDWEQLTDVLEQLVLRFPKKDYWSQLAAVYGQAGNERRQTAVYEVAYRQGFLDREDDVILFAQLLLSEETPYRAAVVLQESIDAGSLAPTDVHLRFLAQAWTLAHEQEKAIGTLRRASEVAEGGEIDARLAILLLDAGHFEDAAAAARTALDKGVDRADDVRVTLGMALFERNDLRAAREAFLRAAEAEESRQIALQWIAYIDAEQARQEQMAQSMQPSIP